MEKPRKRSLKDRNSMALDIYARNYLRVSSLDILMDLISSHDMEKMKFHILGDGTNTIFNGNFDGILLDNQISGVELIKDNKESAIHRIGGGENWDKVVRELSKKELSGIENLAYIPGTVGAAPVQNIAAYGQQISDVLEEVETIDLLTGKERVFKCEDCDFRYRYSVFKEPEMKRYYITHITMKLSKDPQFDTDYHSRFPNESLQNWLKEEAQPPYKPTDVANAVTDLRKYKLPSVEEYGTCGSAFVNPFVTVEKYKQLAEIVPDLQSYPVTSMDYSRKDWDNIDKEDLVKIPAGRLLDELGWKGKWIGNVGTFDKHALCVVTNKEASPKELLKYMDQMKKSVKDAYDVDLKSEIVIVN